jgi:hypothetical protein
VWLNGAFQAGETDLIIFRKPDGLKSNLATGMLLFADNGYQGENQVNIPNPLDNNLVKKFKQRARARHETLNGRLKKFKILSDRFRHPVEKHETAFEAVCVIVQYAMEIDSPLFEI